MVGVTAVLGQVHPDNTTIAPDAAAYMVLLIGTIRTRVRAATAGHWHSGYTDAISEAFPGELAKHAVSEMMKAATRLSAVENVTAAQSKEVRESSVGEYIDAEVMELSGDAARDTGVTEIQVYHIITAIGYDEELALLFARELPPMPLRPHVTLLDITATTVARYKSRGEVRVYAIMADMDRMFPDREVTDLAIVTIWNMVQHYFQLFARVNDARFQEWLLELPTTGEVPPETKAAVPGAVVIPLHVLAYRKISGLLVAALRHLVPVGNIQYTHVLYAALRNPYYDLSKYLRLTSLT